MPVLALLKTHWRKLVVPLLLVAAFLGGRLAAPTRVETREVEVERVVEVVRTVQAAAEVRYVDRVQRVVVTREVRPDGSSSERTETDTREQGASAQASQTATQASREALREVTKERVVEVRPSLRVSALAGVDLGSVWAGTPRAELGAVVEYRLVGPLSVGAWGLSSRRGGVSLSLEF